MSEKRRFLSNKVGKLGDNVEKFKKEYSKLWWETETNFPQLGKIYSKSEQKTIENELSTFIDEASGKVKDYPSEKEKQNIWLEDFITGLKKFAKQMLKLSDVYLDSIFNEGFIQSTREFIERVKKFDSSLEIGNIYQALRNVWIMNSLQIYLDFEIKHSDAIFAYSMIYPYSDNYMDDVSESHENKFSLTGNLKDWLEGQDSSWQTSQGEKIYKLIKIIEKQYDRNSFPGVYQSLLAIYNAQIKSLLQQRKHSLPYEMNIVDISFEKGGTSVLADGFLVSGDLNDVQADFCFGFGAFLQLGDDIQDVAEDKKNNLMTIFSQTAGKYALDKLANKLLNFISNVVDLKLDEQKASRKILKELILRNCYYLITEAVGKNKRLYSKDYVSKIQGHFPVRFSYLKELRKKMKNKFLDEKKYVIDLDFISTVLLTAASRTIYGK